MPLFTAPRAVLAIAALSLCVSQGRAAETYAIGPADRLRITVSQWMPAAANAQWSGSGGEFQTRLDGQFTVDTGGSLSLPLVGDVPAAGRAAPELAREISDLFQAKLGTINAPSASVEVIEYRPFFVVGVVERPGNYPYRPGMTVLHALSIAGGMYRRPDVDLGRYERELMTASGEGAIQAGTRDALIASIARLEAEHAGRDAITFPDELLARRAEPQVARIMGDELKLLTQRQSALHAAVGNQMRLKKLAESQSVALAAQAAAVDRQIAVARHEIETQTDLVNRGLSRRPILFPIESRLAEAEAKQRQLQSDLLRNAQDVARAEQTAAELRATRQTELLDQIKAAQAGLEQARERLATNIRIVNHSDTEVQRRSGEAQPRYTILRREGDRLRERPAVETARVEPGDIVRVTLQTQARGAPRPSDASTELREVEPGAAPAQRDTQVSDAGH